METPKTPSKLESEPVESLPEKPVTDDAAEDVKGGIGIIRRAQLDEIAASNAIRER